MKYRSRLDIISVILRETSKRGGISKTRIMYEAYLSWQQLNEYLDYLLSHKLLAQNGSEYVVTDKGIEALKLINSLEALIPQPRGETAEHSKERKHYEF